MGLDEILSAKLLPKSGTPSDEWRLWEKKSLNLHRGFLLWRPPAVGQSYKEIAKRVREKVREEFKISWWRGFAFGVLLDLPFIPPDAESAMDSIDTRNNARGTWQWSLVLFREPKMGVGMHTWIEGYLTSVYVDLVAHQAAEGFHMSSLRKEKDSLMQFLTAASRRNFKEFGP